MAAPGGKYFIQDQLHTPHPHHESFKALWETKWKAPCEMGVYPFMFGSIKDFQPIVDELIAKDMKEPYDWDAYAQTFFPQAERLVADAAAAEVEGNSEKASELYMRGSAVYRISRFPAPRSEKQKEAWEKGKEAARKGLALRDAPTYEVTIPHTYATAGDGQTLPGFYHLPSSATPNSKVPLVVIFTGLDGYRTDLAIWIQSWHDVGCAVLIVEIPGTGDNPADPSDPISPDRVWNSMWDWISQQESVDQRRVVCWAFSTGGYYAIRMAHTHSDKLAGVAAQGGGCHAMFDPEWLEASNLKEYPFDLGKTLAWKFGYGTDFERFKKEASDKYSLLKDGTLDQQGCARTLLINGDEDSIFPVDDYYLAVQHGDPKEMRVVPGTSHMGEPAAFTIILKWLAQRLDIMIDPVAFLQKTPLKTKY